VVSTATSPERPLRSRGRRKWLITFLVAIVLIGVLNWIGITYDGTMVVGFHLWQIFTICGILLFSGLMSGLSGFGFSAVGAVCLLLIPPKLAVPLLMALSTANQFMSIGQLKEDMPKSMAEAWPKGCAPYILGGVVGVPLGTYLLHHLPAPKLMLVFGGFLILYSIYSIFKPANAKVSGPSGALAGTVVGFLGGTLGGFTAFPGATVVVWTGLKELPKKLTRSIVQPYILVLQVVSLITNALTTPGIFGRTFWVLLAITIPVVLPGTLGGVWLYRRISDVNFRRISFFLLGVSGVTLLAKAIPAMFGHH
jgi:hypothetical protein